MTQETDQNLPEDNPDFKDTPKGLDLTTSRSTIVTKDEEDFQPAEKTGRPRAPINWDRVEMAMSIGGDLKMCAMYGGVHWNTLERRIKARYGEGFKEVRSAFLTDRKAMALTKAWKAVERGDWKAVEWANRVFNGLNPRAMDKKEEDDADDFEFNVNYSLDKHPDVVEAEFRESQHDDED